ncbi:MAG: serine/threonine protein kinase [Polyangiaceae bacterium]|nr:serine/threonine protein kinase [Polyangiaceae bacterium]
MPESRWSGASAARLGSVPTDSSGDLRLLQDRLALFGLVVFALATSFYLAIAILSAFTLGPASLPGWVLNPGRIWHLAAMLAAAGLWLVARGRWQLTAQELGVLDLVGTACACWSLAMMGRRFQTSEGIAAAMLATVHITMARSILVPSTAMRSFWTTLLAVCPLAPIAAASPGLSSASHAQGHHPEFRALFVFTEYALWSAAAITIATVASKIIYGLQAKVREARQLGQYTILEKIGEGGMGEVFKASHALLRRPTAIKLIDSRYVDPHTLRRFEKEVQLTSMLTHPNTISIYDYGRTHDGVFYYAMEYLEGLNLEQLVRVDGPLPPGRVIHVLRQVCGSLGEAHSAGLIHRDIKPANVFLCCRGGSPDVIKVLDFGLVKDKRPGQDATLSATAAVAGTPLYMSPEAICAPNQVDARSDLYALGAVGYFLLTGLPLFAADTVVEICAQHLHTIPVRPSERAGRPLPTDLEDVLLRCLEKDPARRFPDALALSESLEALQHANDWSEAEARQWWEQRATLSRPRAQPLQNMPTENASRRTVGVDLARRAKIISGTEH